MLAIIRHLPVVLLFAVGAQAQETYGPSAPENKNHFYFHPTLTVLSLAIDEIPIFLALTYERYLENGNSFIWQPQAVVGSSTSANEVEVSQFSLVNYLGMRKYVNGSFNKGFYIQGLGAIQAGSFNAEKADSPDKASGFVSAFGILGYLGYKWTNIFMDIGAPAAT